MRAINPLVIFSFLVFSCSQEKKTPPLTAEEIHKSIITIDTHDDINVGNFTDSLNYSTETQSQVHIPGMEAGGLDVAWFIVYTGQGDLTQEGYALAASNADDKFNAIHRLVSEYATDRIELALTAADVLRIWKSGKKIAMIGVENGFPIGEDVNNVEVFYNRGARYMSLAHNGHSQLSDSNTGEKDGIYLHNGLSKLGKEVIDKMNYYGMMIDISHPSKEAIREMALRSKAPIIASHSSARALCNHSRNLDDEQLQWVKQSDGVVQTVAFSSYLNSEKHNNYNKAKDSLLKVIGEKNNIAVLDKYEMRALDFDELQTYLVQRKKLMELAEKQMEALKDKVPPVSVSDFVDHIDYIKNKIGIDHVGISSDFDGGGGIEGWSNASESLNVTKELVKRGYTKEEIEKIWGGNLLRVMERVEAVAEDLQKLQEE
ncbi:dipeptidase [Candidatus Arcticimaribacter forsetii]|uniref:dipeptidase n=1 Tax=Candidatus Arcticimaribacter forsetii TaxID=2820661 RepID=UPI0020771C04|nr:dipeptidase [Candidatus Arcticimaribacter forsetii]MDB4717149.1 dipeptidase [Flavobacteriaceae bacterium]